LRKTSFFNKATTTAHGSNLETPNTKYLVALKPKNVNNKI
jgi:hypothetical protein